jgi:hypothetical protein
MVVIINAVGSAPSPLKRSTSALMAILVVASLRDDAARKCPLMSPLAVVKVPVLTATDYVGFSFRTS